MQNIDGTDDVDDGMSVADVDEVNDCAVDFIDDTIQNQDASNYRLMNITRDSPDALLHQSTTTDFLYRNIIWCFLQSTQKKDVFEFRWTGDSRLNR